MIRFDDISFGYRDNAVLQSVSGQFNAGQLIVLIGENGAGKSTLLHILSGNIKTCGCISFNGQALEDYSDLELAKHRAVLMQQENMAFAFSIPDLISLGRRHIEESSAQRNQQISRYLQAFDLQSLMNQSTSQLSGGQLQRVHAARCFAQLDALNPDCQDKLMMLDEPTSALDLHYQHKLLNQVRRFVDRGNCAVVVLHDLNLASLYADNIVLLSDGKIQQQGCGQQVLQEQVLQPVYRTKMHAIPHPTLDKTMIFSELQEN